jgi:hypothetical protein
MLEKDFLCRCEEEFGGGTGTVSHPGKTSKHIITKWWYN